MYGRSINLNRQRSESPYEPPNPIKYEPHTSRSAVSQKHLTGSSKAYTDTGVAHQKQYEPPEQFEPLSSKGKQDSAQHNASRHEALWFPDQSYNEHRDPQIVATTPSTKSLHEARKEAQSAILNLWPFKVRFHDYLEEGIDEAVIRRQFESLGMSQAVAPIIQSQSQDGGDSSKVIPNAATQRAPLGDSTNKPNTEVPLNGRVDHVLTRIDSALQEIPRATNTDGKLENNINASEERKDRIARLLAEKFKKLPSSVMQIDSPTGSASPEAAGVANKASQSTAKADKERLLRQKMEALQKSREQRAQKAAAKSVAVNTGQQTVNAQTTQPSQVTRPSHEPAPTRSTPPPQSTSKQSMPSIPGLFLASTTPTVPVHNAAPLILQNPNLRKRPVASDFDRPPSAETSYKRPFGQSRNDQPLLIEVSDEESEDEDEGEITATLEVNDSQAVNPTIQPQSGRGTPTTRSIRDLPPLSDFPPRKLFPQNAPAINTPPAPQPASRPVVSKPEDLQRKELEILAMKKKIAEAERKKKAKLNMSGSQTPISSNSNSSPAMFNSEVSMTEKIEASVQIERLIDDASRQVDQDQLKLSEAHAVQEAKEDELKQNEAEQRRLRRAKIAADLPVVDAEVEKGQQKLADLRAEIAKIEAAVQQGLAEKQRLAEEMEKLGQEADEQLSIQKEKLRDLRLEVADDTTGMSSIHFETTEVLPHSVLRPLFFKYAQQLTSAFLALEALENIEPIREASAPTSMEESPVTAVVHLQPALTETIESSLITRSTSNDTTSAPTEYPLDVDEVPSAPSDPTKEAADEKDTVPADNDLEEDAEPILTPDQALEAALQEASARAEAESHEVPDSDVEMANSYAPDPDVLAPMFTASPEEDMEIDNGTSGDADELPNIADGESDTYEPPEATPPATDAVAFVDSPPFSPAPPSAVSDVPINHQADEASPSPIPGDAVVLKQYENILATAPPVIQVF
jgi:hypothetical protein